ncbi:MAG: hypothetical protein COA58_14460 [Bacteroidetes bacterium]|nr:MAG: hypothetical protein COA58_14460 [Bacteroidota bacterium]
MKKTFKLFMVLALGAGVFTLQSCSDDTTTTEPTPTSPTCYITQEKITSDGDIETIDYTYNSDNNITMAISTGDGFSDTTIFEYSGGRLSLAKDESTEATFIYGAGSNVPERINVKTDGIDAGYTILTATDGRVTKIENHDTEDGDVIDDVIFITYNASGSVTDAEAQDYDADTDEYTTTLTLGNVITDGKKNPYETSFVFFYMNDDNPISLGASNVVSATLTVNSLEIPYASSFDYNSNDYPSSGSSTLFGFNTTTDYTYNCK